MNLTKPKIFLSFSLACIIGIVLGKFLNYQVMTLSAMVFVIIAALGWGNKNAKIIGLLGLTLLLGSFRFAHTRQSNPIQSFYGQKWNLQGIIVEEPDVRSDKTYLTLGKISIDSRQVAGRLLLVVKRFPEYEYGQKLILNGKVAEPKDAAAAGEFSYKNYLSRFGVYGLIYFPKILKVEPNHGNTFKAAILKLKKNFVAATEKILPEPQNAFLLGLLVGNRRSIPPDLLDEFNKTGTTHIVAISGYNITIIAWAIDKLLQRFGKRVSFGISLAAIIVFVILTGASASVVRAGIMGALVLIALNIGRLYAITNALIFTAAVMLAYNPSILHFDIGFQLSFLALMGLVYISPIIEKYFLIIPKFFREPLVATLSAQIFTLPILLYNFGRLSLIAPLTNVLAMIAVPTTMLFGFLTGIAAMILTKLAVPFAAVSWVLLSYILKVIGISASIPLAALDISKTSIFIVVIYYLGLSSFLVYYYHPKLWQKFKLWKVKPSVT